MDERRFCQKKYLSAGGETEEWYSDAGNDAFSAMTATLEPNDFRVSKLVPAPSLSDDGLTELESRNILRLEFLEENPTEVLFVCDFRN